MAKICQNDGSTGPGGREFCVANVVIEPDPDIQELHGQRCLPPLVAKRSGTKRDNIMQAGKNVHGKHVTEASRLS